MFGCAFDYLPGKILNVKVFTTFFHGQPVRDRLGGIISYMVIT